MNFSLAMVSGFNYDCSKARSAFTENNITNRTPSCDHAADIARGEDSSRADFAAFALHNAMTKCSPARAQDRATTVFDCRMAG
jgi:hypothetical protein